MVYEGLLSHRVHQSTMYTVTRDACSQTKGHLDWRGAACLMWRHHSGSQEGRRRSGPIPKTALTRCCSQTAAALAESALVAAGANRQHAPGRTALPARMRLRAAVGGHLHGAPQGRLLDTPAARCADAWVSEYSHAWRALRRPRGPAVGGPGQAPGAVGPHWRYAGGTAAAWGRWRLQWLACRPCPSAERLQGWTSSASCPCSASLAIRDSKRGNQ